MLFSGADELKRGGGRSIDDDGGALSTCKFGALSAGDDRGLEMSRRGFWTG